MSAETLNEQNQLWRCCRSRCRWAGTDAEKTRKPDELGYTLVCPRCGCDEFYKAKRKARSIPKDNGDTFITGPDIVTLKQPIKE